MNYSIVRTKLTKQNVETEILLITKTPEHYLNQCFGITNPIIDEKYQISDNMFVHFQKKGKQNEHSHTY